MEWVPCEEQVGTLGCREGHCATCLLESGTGEAWVLCVGGYCDGERDGAVIASKVSALPALRWVTLSRGTACFECDGASLTRAGGDAAAVAYLFGGLDAAMDRCNRLVCLSLQHAEGGPTLSAVALQALGDIPPPRTQHSAGGTGTHLFVFGGETDDAEQNNDLYQLSLDRLVWTCVRVGPKVPPPRLLAGPLVFVSSQVCVLYGGAHFINGDIKSLDDVWALDVSSGGEWSQLRSDVDDKDGGDSIFPRSNGHAGGLLRCRDGIAAVFVGGKDAAEGCDKAKQVELSNIAGGRSYLSLVEPALTGSTEGPHWRYTPAVAETRCGLVLLGGQCRHPQEVTTFLLRHSDGAEMC
ncbi:hypothetical protein DQ04_00101100 [Trypanosoma grayi]|uniref:hypothetical protein n=1 Tax=Trypanosoma grayi TaxID=71804 RepID=UPI0004F45060|nr:hypothetical protein DQ04_00101100 [Trypanosoma grayi]KEG15343.1 hypothetical protein DQ04_00101100 [Trypanosoma grayi]